MSSSPFASDISSPFTRHRLSAPTIFLPTLTATPLAPANRGVLISKVIRFRSRKALNVTALILGVLLALATVAPIRAGEAPRQAWVRD